MRDEECVARRQSVLIASDRVEQFERVKRGLAERPDSPWHAQQLAYFNRAPAHLALNPIALLDKVAADALRGFARGGRPLDASRVFVCAVAQEDLTAKAEGYDDGSALVQVSDATLSLIGYLAQLATQCLRPSAIAGMMARVGYLRPWRHRAPSPTDHGRLVAALRYYVQSQRLFASAAKLPFGMRRRDEDFAAALMLFATTFVIGHELAHVSLGHAWTPGAESAADELAADDMAFAMVGTTYPVTPGTAARAAGCAAVVALLAVGLSERALLVRTTHTYPPARQRIARLVAQDPATSQAVELLSGLIAAVDGASDLGQAVSRDSWTSLPAAGVVTDGRETQIEAIADLDEVQAAQSETLLDTLRTAAANGFPALATSLKGADPEATLRGWGLAPAVVARLLDTGSPLGFYTLQHAIAGASLMRDVADDGLRLAMSVAAARLVETALRDRAPEDAGL